MKTLFFVVAGFLLSATLGYAVDNDLELTLTTWHSIDRRDIASSGNPKCVHSLVNLEKALVTARTMASLVGQYGVPDAEFNPARWPPKDRGIMMSGGIIYVNGAMLGHEEDLLFRYDFPGQGRVYITTTKDQHIERAHFSSFDGHVKELIKQP